MSGRRSLTGAGLTVLALCASAGAALADGGTADVEVRAIGAGVRLATPGCPEGGRASLLPEGRTSFEDGYVLDLASGGEERTGSWLAVEDGRYSVEVRCADGSRLGGGPVRVPGPVPSSGAPSREALPSGAASVPARESDPYADGDTARPVPPSASPSAPAAPGSPSPSVSASPSASVSASLPGWWPPGAVEGGLGGGAAHESSGSFRAGVALVAGAVASGLAWLLRRRLTRR